MARKPGGHSRAQIARNSNDRRRGSFALPFVFLLLPAGHIIASIFVSSVCERLDDGCGKVLFRSTLATRRRRKLSTPSQPSGGRRPDPGVRQMSVSSRVHTKADDGPEVLWEDSERVFCRARRPDADGKLQDVLIVTPAAEHPTPASLDRLAHEYALKMSWTARGPCGRWR
jgi:hypothetical protein